MSSRQKGMKVQTRSTMASEGGSRRRRGSKQEEPYRGLIPSLPDELALLCLARVPRAQHAVLSAVCRSWRRLLQTGVFYDIRQELSLTEEWLFLWTQDSSRANVWHGYDPQSNRWFTLPPLPNEQCTAGNSASAVVDGKLFVVGGQLDNGNACSCVSYFDMQHFSWKSAAPLTIARAKCMAGVINNQLYVVGGFTERDQDAGPTAEAYNPVKNEWRLISSMKISMELYDSAVLGNKFYVVNSSSENLVGLVYDPKQDEWVYMAHGLNTGWQSKTAAMNGRLYAVGDSHSLEGKNEISVYNERKDAWETIKGVLEDSAPVLAWGPELVSLGGKLCIVGTGLQPRIGATRAAVAVVEVSDSKTEPAKPSASLKFYEDITLKIRFSDPLPRGACQVLAL
ncbi:F-box/kelch-repeat protein At1g55270 isoform X1 [Physcomitrium patens]|uniref:F-box domain-containing protein n=1 Tax=Physcomitrium patens TaxID=3218 RepID=A0A2K1L1B5_PHYPA|nr:F-box/kelch-repeat protein At1g55270-like isoform X1 [Physcomitrium patens]XP_024360468.1 F-box/kelch-repeat protein At1g55270-like isoform X1 [Physcomitrium patens]XP_024360477.1 F-box/kelch-repeat protein At1g55270-like isoform X1 [Physcomitrium patens]XP_024360484.1 F-box/kelch-repeat protein At1g55270-like isoform X1 [Physcomitrium patens]XP_024360493.1 F-box/kelch-repeat protein At1g55270-like isoform X1 [Physcomitrium patens]XP_024360501.1 F-box/kelch-repeat protein At1g55270-like iso|eukprot:XP_024360461.1 F-box/kelch-repeat protein At1g55270-like isoform X1 [Physcomitrella patens]